MLKVVAITAEYKGIPVIGNGVEVFKNVERCLLCNWDGYVIQVYDGHPDSLTNSWFLPQDKGVPPVYGVDSKGRVICSIRLFSGDSSSENEVERKQHFHIVKVNSTSPYSGA